MAEDQVWSPVWDGPAALDAYFPGHGESRMRAWQET